MITRNPYLCLRKHPMPFPFHSWSWCFEQAALWPESLWPPSRLEPFASTLVCTGVPSWKRENPHPTEVPSRVYMDTSDVTGRRCLGWRRHENSGIGIKTSPFALQGQPLGTFWSRRTDHTKLRYPLHQWNKSCFFFVECSLSVYSILTKCTTSTLSDHAVKSGFSLSREERPFGPQRTQLFFLSPWKTK